MHVSPSKLCWLVVVVMMLAATPALADSALRQTGYAVQQTLNAAQVGAVYSLLAVAYALLHGITNRIILSFGDIATFGAFATIYTMMFMLFANWQTGLAIATVFL